MKKLFLVTELNGSVQRFAREEDIEKGYYFIDGIDFFSCSDEELEKIKENEYSIFDEEFKGKKSKSIDNFMQLEEIEEEKRKFEYVLAFGNLYKSKEFDIEAENYLCYFANNGEYKTIQLEDQFEEVELIGTSNWHLNKEEKTYCYNDLKTYSILKTKDNEFYIVCDLSSDDRFAEVETYSKEEVEELLNVVLDDKEQVEERIIF